jgi:hypothetical protein
MFQLLALVNNASDDDRIPLPQTISTYVVDALQMKVVTEMTARPMQVPPLKAD